MGVWGMGLTQSDEFCEIYERFMDRYNYGDEVSAIVSDILAEYENEFSHDDGILHDVYFALAKAEWMCCAPSERVQKRVREIIESDANIAFYRESGAKDADLKLRKKNLDKFLNSLQTPRAKPRQRRIDPLDRVKEFPPVKVGECYSYKHENGHRIFIILDRFKEIGWNEQLCCCILKNTFLNSDIDIMNEQIGFISYFVGLEFLAKSSIKRIGEIHVPEDFRKKLPSDNIYWLDNKTAFHRDIPSPMDCTLGELFKNK